MFSKKFTYSFTFLGFEAEDATDDGIEYLVKKHPEILMFQLGKENRSKLNWVK